MALRPLAVAVAVVTALVVPLSASPKAPASQSSAATETSLPSLTTVPNLTTVPSPLGSTPTTRTPPPPPPVSAPPTTVPRFSGFLAQSVDFVSPDDGFVLGYVRCGKKVCYALRRTLDRGASWLTLPAPPFGVGPGVSELHFANARDGWALGATLWATYDGGRSWHQADLGGPVAAVASGGREAYALAEACPTQSSSCKRPGGLYRSAVGTVRWAEVQGAPAGLGADGGQVSLVVEDKTIFLASAYPRPGLFVSADGAHFSRLPVPCSPKSSTGPGPFRPGQLAASSPSDLVVTCYGLPNMAYLPTELFISHDGGHSFHALPTPTLLGQGAEAAMAGPATLVLGTSSPGGTWLERAVAPGTSWSTPFQRHDEGAGLSDLAFVDPLHGAFVYCPVPFAFDYFGPRGAPGGTVYLTDDGGASWSAVHVPS